MQGLFSGEWGRRAGEVPSKWRSWRSLGSPPRWSLDVRPVKTLFLIAEHVCGFGVKITVTSGRCAWGHRVDLWQMPWIISYQITGLGPSTNIFSTTQIVSRIALLSQTPSPLRNPSGFPQKTDLFSLYTVCSHLKHTLYSKKCLQYSFYPLISELLKCKLRPLCSLRTLHSIQGRAEMFSNSEGASEWMNLAGPLTSSVYFSHMPDWSYPFR